MKTSKSIMAEPISCLRHRSFFFMHYCETSKKFCTVVSLLVPSCNEMHQSKLLSSSLWLLLFVCLVEPDTGLSYVGNANAPSSDPLRISSQWVEGMCRLSFLQRQCKDCLHFILCGACSFTKESVESVALGVCVTKSVQVSESKSRAVSPIACTMSESVHSWFGWLEAVLILTANSDLVLVLVF